MKEFNISKQNNQYNYQVYHNIQLENFEKIFFTKYLSYTQTQKHSQ